jgi:hypothetical protein
LSLFNANPFCWLRSPQATIMPFVTNLVLLKSPWWVGVHWGGLVIFKTYYAKKVLLNILIILSLKIQKNHPKYENTIQGKPKSNPFWASQVDPNLTTVPMTNVRHKIIHKRFSQKKTKNKNNHWYSSKLFKMNLHWVIIINNTRCTFAYLFLKCWKSRKLNLKMTNLIFLIYKYLAKMSIIKCRCGIFLM